MARGKRWFRGAELMGKRRAAKYQRAAEAERTVNSQPPAHPYNEITCDNAAFEEYYKAQGICATEEWDDFMAIQRLRLPGQWDTASKVDMKKDEDFREVREQIIDEDFRGALTRQEAVSMLPCLFLDIQPHHLVLDMCSSPGSKTSEILDMLQWEAQLREARDSGLSIGIRPVDGAVVANDVDLKRAVTLTHQVQKLASPSVAVSCLDATFFPTLPEETNNPSEKVVPSGKAAVRQDPSGDGTLRKNMDIWRSWNTGGGHSMHAIQLSILYRGLQLLRIGGKIVYSTCSMNPLEDEAVIATVLSQQHGRLEIVDPPALPELKWTRGKSSWLVPSPPANQTQSTSRGSAAPIESSGCKTAFYCTFDEVPEGFRHRIRPTMFPPPGADSMMLEKCVRILPHHNNTGGFFVCCLRKLAELDSSSIFISNKSKEKAATEVRQQDRTSLRKQDFRKRFKCADTKAIHSGQDASCNARENIDESATSVAASAAILERNPLFDEELLPEGSSEQTPATPMHIDNISGRVSTVQQMAGEEDSLYELASAASKPGGLFHHLLPATCGAEGLEEVRLIVDFFGLSSRIPLEGAALMASFMRRRIIFVSLVVARILLLPEAGVVRSCELEALEKQQQLLNLASCRNQDGSLEAGGAICVICPPTFIPPSDVAEVDLYPAATASLGSEVTRLHHDLAARYPVKNNPSFTSIADSICVACMITKGGNLHAYMNKKESRALACHLFHLPKQ
ncbi:Ncl1p, related protein [Cyclospora cayetanensis]|uniref:Ncl1p, related protein n=1 Tax=Cyclospora cayetanensis TaxID=88456 RepID=A0A1D3CXT8_9EIME|nr:Ncl1p, related protein [Cyclospora cayetanensis]